MALGANLGNPIETVKQAEEALKALPRSTVVAVSSLYRTAPVGLHDQPDFINAVAAVETELLPGELLDELFAIEVHFGRQRSIRNAPRTLDLDLLLHGETVSPDPQITLPHPRMHERAFVLMPLHEIAPQLSIPDRGPVADLLAACVGQGIAKL